MILGFVVLVFALVRPDLFNEGLGIVAVGAGAAGLGYAMFAENLAHETRRGEINEKVAMLRAYNATPVEDLSAGRIVSDMESLEYFTSQRSATEAQVKNIAVEGNRLVTLMEKPYPKEAKSVDSVLVRILAIYKKRREDYVSTT